MDKDKIIELLNQDLEGEHGAIIQYLTHAYAIGEGDAVTIFTNVTMFSTYFDMTVEEIIPYEVGKQVNRARLKALMAAMK